MLGLIILGLLMVVFGHFMRVQAEEYKKQVDAMKGQVKEKNCPPHKWEYANVNGTERLRCKLCPLVPGDNSYQPRGGT